MFDDLFYEAESEFGGVYVDGVILYFTPSLDTQEPKKRFKVKKCNQKRSKKLSVANNEYKLSRLKYRLKKSFLFLVSFYYLQVFHFLQNQQKKLL